MKINENKNVILLVSIVLCILIILDLILNALNFATNRKIKKYAYDTYWDVKSIDGTVDYISDSISDIKDDIEDIEISIKSIEYEL